MKQLFSTNTVKLTAGITVFVTEYLMNLSEVQLVQC